MRRDLTALLKMDTRPNRRDLQSIAVTRPMLAGPMMTRYDILMVVRTITNFIGQQPEQPPPQSDYEKKKQTFITRAIWTIIMIAFFFVSMFAGHIYIMMIVTAIQIISFKEVIAISNVPSRARQLRFTKTLNWYFLGTTMYFLYGESVIYYFKHIILVDRVLLPFATHHRFISFMLYVMGE